jgi:protein-disulfide isomerase
MRWGLIDGWIDTSGRKLMSRSIMIGLLPLLWGRLALAQTASCDRLSGDKSRLAQELLQSQHPYDCCDESLARCLAKTPTCPLARRLADNLCRRVESGQEKTVILHALSRRAMSMLPGGPKAKLVLDDAPMAGDATAPVQLVEFACARCPFCGQITPKLHQAVSEGPLKGKVRLYLKVFPARSHEYSKEAGLAFLAAHRLKQFWPFALHAFAHVQDFSPDRMGDWAKELGFDAAVFSQLQQDPAVQEQLVANKKEGILNKVEVTPTFFINGRKYQGDLEWDELLDVLQEEFDRINSRTVVP